MVYQGGTNNSNKINSEICLAGEIKIFGKPHTEEMKTNYRPGLFIVVVVVVHAYHIREFTSSYNFMAVREISEKEGEKSPEEWQKRQTYRERPLPILP